MEKEMTVSGVMKTQEIMESQSYYGIKKAVEEGSVVRLKNGVYASAEALADTMIDIERVVPKGVLPAVVPKGALPAVVPKGVVWPETMPAGGTMIPGVGGMMNEGAECAAVSPPQ